MLAIWFVPVEKPLLSGIVEDPLGLIDRLYGRLWDLGGATYFDFGSSKN